MSASIPAETNVGRKRDHSGPGHAVHDRRSAIPSGAPALSEPRVSRRILAAWLPWWPTERLARRRPEARTHPFVTVTEARNRLVIAASNSLATRAGLTPGMSLADGRAIVPGIITRPADPATDARALERLARWTNRFTPRVMPDGPDTIFLDIAGCEHLFGGEEALMAALRRALEDFGLTVRLALADAPGAAWALAHYGPGDPAVVPAGAEPSTLRRALANLPVAALRLSAEVAEALRSFGLDTIRTLFPLESVELIRRFGTEPVRRLDQALGRVTEPITPLPPLPAREVRRAFPEPISTPADIRAATASLVDRLCRLLTRSGEGARQLRLICHRVDGGRQSIGVGTSRPRRRAKSLLDLFAEKLPRIEPGFGIDEIVLVAEVVEVVSELQTNWLAEATTRHHADNEEALANLLDRLGNRFGFGRIGRAVPHQSWLPERAACRERVDGRGDRPGAASNTPGSLSALARSVARSPPAAGWPEGRRRPLRLLSPPEPVEILTEEGFALEFGGKPRSGTKPGSGGSIAEFRLRTSGFQYRGRFHPLRKVEGPERIDCEWWRGETTRRDYYLAEDESGCRYWLYRENPADEAEDGKGKVGRAGARIMPGVVAVQRWFLHGVFG